MKALIPLYFSQDTTTISKKDACLIHLAKNHPGIHTVNVLVLNNTPILHHGFALGTHKAYQSSTQSLGESAHCISQLGRKHDIVLTHTQNAIAPTIAHLLNWPHRYGFPLSPQTVASCYTAPPPPERLHTTSTSVQIEDTAVNTTHQPLISVTDNLEQFISLLYDAAILGDANNDASVLFAAGKGVANTKLFIECTNALNTNVAFSYGAFSTGLLHQKTLVGKSGNCVSPTVYFAFGISGAPEHLCGIENAIIVAINKDPTAPIFRYAQYGFVGDAETALIALKKHRLLVDINPQILNN